MQTWICTIEFKKPTAWPGGNIAIRTGCTITYYLSAETRCQVESIDLFLYYYLLKATLQTITISMMELLTSNDLQT
jgi:hypothetical protein